MDASHDKEIKTRAQQVRLNLWAMHFTNPTVALAAFPAGSVFDSFQPPRNTGEGGGDEFNSLCEGDGERGRQFLKERSVVKA